MTTPCGTTERSIRSTAGMCGQECAKPGCVASSAWTRPSRCSSRGAMCACGAASRRCTEWRRPKRRRPSHHVRPPSTKKRALGWRTSLSGLAHLCTRLSRYPMLVGEHRCPRPKTKGAPGKSGPAIFALKISEDRCSRASPKQICPQNQNPQNGHLMARFDWGLGAVCFGANPVAAVFGSAPGSATPPEHRIHFKPTSQEALLKQDISTLLGIGHFYFALTGTRLSLSHCDSLVRAPGKAYSLLSGRSRTTPHETPSLMFDHWCGCTAYYRRPRPDRLLAIPQNRIPHKLLRQKHGLSGHLPWWRGRFERHRDRTFGESATHAGGYLLLEPASRDHDSRHPDLLAGFRPN